MKISTFIIGIVFVGMIITGVGLYISELENNYGGTIDDSKFTSLDKSAQIKNLTEDINEDLQGIDVTSNPLDVVGGFLKSGYTVIKVTFASFGIFTEMATTTYQEVPTLSVYGAYLISIAFIIFIFIVISVLVGRDT